jgi:hypothetical protein
LYDTAWKSRAKKAEVEGIEKDTEGGVERIELRFVLKANNDISVSDMKTVFQDKGKVLDLIS